METRRQSQPRRCANRALPDERWRKDLYVGAERRSVKASDRGRRLSRWLADKRFESLASRTRHRDAIEEVVAQSIRERSRDKVLVAFGDAAFRRPISSMADLARDDHIGRSTSGRRREAALPPAHPHARFAGEDEPRHLDSPSLGEHTIEVLRETLGYSEGNRSARGDDNAKAYGYGHV